MRTRAIAALIVAAQLITGCTLENAHTVQAGVAPSHGTHEVARGTLNVLTTTPLLADMVRNVAGNAAQVTSLMPRGVNPHTYEPTLRDARDAAYADVAFSNYMMLEEQSVLRTMDANLPVGVENVWLAERATKYGAQLRSLVEHAALDATWLGFRVQGDDEPAKRRLSREAHFTLDGVSGPGNTATYITETFGHPAVLFNGADGVGEDDQVSLATNAHTHASWAFTEPGLYTLDLGVHVTDDAGQVGDSGESVTSLDGATGRVTFAVGINPADVAPGTTIIENGHVDITADLERGALGLLWDGMEDTWISADDAVIVVPSKTLQPVPADPAFRFIAKPGTPVYQLPQAVLGRHVHGDIDPHLWHDVRNVRAYADVIAEELIGADPRNAQLYRSAADQYKDKLADLDHRVREAINGIPEAHRVLLTTHEGFGYLADAYGLRDAGVLTPSASIEPSLADRQRLAATITNLGVPAVFTVAGDQVGSSTMHDVARSAGVRVCELLGDTFTGDVDSYIDLMATNAATLERCLQ